MAVDHYFDAPVLLAPSRSRIRRYRPGIAVADGRHRVRDAPRVRLSHPALFARAFPITPPEWRSLPRARSVRDATTRSRPHYRDAGPPPGVNHHCPARTLRPSPSPPNLGACLASRTNRSAAPEVAREIVFAPRRNRGVLLPAGLVPEVEAAELAQPVPRPWLQPLPGAPLCEHRRLVALPLAASARAWAASSSALRSAP